MNISSQQSFALVLALMLTGCGGEDAQNSVPNSPSPVGKVHVADAFGTVQPDKLSRIDFSQYIRGQGATLASVTSNRPECFVSPPQGMTAEVKVQGASLCQYAFTARNSVNEAVGQLNMLATLATSPELDPLSHTMLLGDADVVFDLTALYGTELPAGYELVPNSLVVQGGVEQGTVQVQGANSILYSPPTKADWDQIVYVLRNPALPDQDIFGSIFVTVSEQSNQAPQISNRKYDYNNQISQKVIAFDTYTIDLAALAGLTITDPDGHEWQLVEVNSYSATVAAVDPNDVTNKKFTFVTPTVGQHIISYIIADHYGGYTTGMIRMTVEAKESPRTWNDLTTTQGYEFSAPGRYSEVINLGVSASPIWDNSVSNTVAAFDLPSALTYCGGQGRLPWLSEINSLMSQHKPGGLDNWPQDKKYLVYDDSGYKSFDITAATAVQNYVATEPHYVTCVKNNLLAFQQTKKQIIADGVSDVLGVINKSNLSTVNVEVEPQVGTLTDTNVSIQLTPSGTDSVTVSAASIKAGTVQFRISSKRADGTIDYLTSALTEFLVDDKTVTLKLDPDTADVVRDTAAIVPDGRVANSTNSTLTRYLLSDANDNPKFGAPVTVSVTNGDAHALITEPSGPAAEVTGVTDANGLLVVKTQSSLGGGAIADIEIDAGATWQQTDRFNYQYADVKDMTRPDTILRTLSEAEAYCASLSFHRLPNIFEFKDELFIPGTRAQAVGDNNKDMCDVYGWPLAGECGGSTNKYWANKWTNVYTADKNLTAQLSDGIISLQPPNILVSEDPFQPLHVACKRIPAASEYIIDSILRTYDESVAHCENLSPAGTYRLPKAEDLIALYKTLGVTQNYTSAMCSQYGWPLYNACGGAAHNNSDQYWTYADTDAHFNQYSKQVRIHMDFSALPTSVTDPNIIGMTACVKK